MLPFTADQFFGIFVAYNTAIWPAQVVAYVLGCVALGALSFKSGTAQPIVRSVLAAMWIWTGIFYHWVFFATVNPVASWFAALFVLQGALLAFCAFRRGNPMREPRGNVSVLTGAAFVAYATVFYPLIGWAAGHAYPRSPSFGVTPCPVTIFTFGMLLLTHSRPPLALLGIPLVWSAIGGSAAVLLNVVEDWALPLSGAITIALALAAKRGRRPRVAP